MMKFIHTLNIKSAILLLITTLFLVACKKDKVVHKTDNNKPPVTLPDEVMFVGTQNIDSNHYTIYLLDAGTGQLVTSYHYPTDGHSDFCKPFVRNGLLYDVERDKISAITMNTGVVLWTDSVGMNTDNASIILYDDTFYGITTSHDGTAGGDFVCALDATKKSSAFLWKTPLPLGGNVYNIPINYYNGLIYVTDQDGSRLTALDAKTGIVKWAITNNSSTYSLTLLNNGIIIVDHTIIDAASGNPTVTVTDPVIPPITPGATRTSSSLEYVTSDLFFVETTQATGSLHWSFLSAIDRASGAEKWRVDFGSFTGEGASRTSIIKWIKSIWNNKLIIEESTEIS
ncbi:MAG: PQQ-binding-like beta-propeller repeat protein, partial [Mucilaginibacter sp.]